MSKWVKRLSELSWLLSHSGYNWKYFTDTFSDIEVLVLEAIEKHYASFVAGDRGNTMSEFCAACSLNIANASTLDDVSETWTWRSSSGNMRRIYYILHSKVLRSFEVIANRELDLGSDHRCVSASIEYIRSTEAWKTRKRSVKGWKPIHDEARQSHKYHSQLETCMNDRFAASLEEFWKIAFEAAPGGGLLLHGTSGLKRSMKSMALKDLICLKERDKQYSRSKSSKQAHP